MRAARRPAEEPANPRPSATMRAARRPAEEPANPRPSATMRAAKRQPTELGPTKPPLARYAQDNSPRASFYWAQRNKVCFVSAVTET
jgi:hypothetical protein